MVLMACSTSSGPSTSASASRTSTPSSSVKPADTKAADLRTRLDLLLGEQVLIVAKQSASAVNHSDAYAGYTTLLTTNGSDLAEVIRSAFGTTAADQFSQTWNIQNGYLVDYTIGVVTHNQSKADGAMSGLANGFVPQFAQLITGLSQVPLDPITQLMTQQELEVKAVIDDQAAQKAASTYADLHTAYAQAARFGDALAPRMAQKFPDKFPGDASIHAVDQRVTLNMLMQESAYLETMSSDAIMRGSNPERSASANALAANADSLGTAFSDLFGNAAGTRFDQILAARDAALAGYAASADAASKQALTQDFVTQITSLAHIGPGPVTDQVIATIKAIDDQRAKASVSLAGDDRAAATAMQPVADATIDSAQR
jgi:hypothetical protein